MQQEQQDPKQQEEQGSKQAAKAQKRKDKDLFPTNSTRNTRNG